MRQVLASCRSALAREGVPGRSPIARERAPTGGVIERRAVGAGPLGAGYAQPGRGSSATARRMLSFQWFRIDCR